MRPHNTHRSPTCHGDLRMVIRYAYKYILEVNCRIYFLLSLCSNMASHIFSLHKTLLRRTAGDVPKCVLASHGENATVSFVKSHPKKISVHHFKAKHLSKRLHSSHDSSSILLLLVLELLSLCDYVPPSRLPAFSVDVFGSSHHSPCGSHGILFAYFLSPLSNLTSAPLFNEACKAVAGRTLAGSDTVLVLSLWALAVSGRALDFGGGRAAGSQRKNSCRRVLTASGHSIMTI